MGPKMCMIACQQNKDCISINHHRDRLDCQIFSWDSMSISQFESKDNCTHYSSLGTPLNTDRCDGAKCAEHHTCVDMLDGSDYCVRTECSAPQFVNVKESAGMDFVGGWRSFTCDNGYELSYGVTSQFMTCKSNGEWTGTTNCTIEKCPEPSAPSNGIIFPGENIIGSIRNVQCVNGYLNLGVPPTIECFDNRTWTNWTGYCKACDDPNIIPHAVISDGNVTVGSNRTYTCNIGFEDNGESPYIRCNESALWTTTEFSCTIVECPEPSAPSNGIIFPGENIIGSIRNVQCVNGYLNLGVPPTIECFDNRTWTNWTGSCKACDNPNSIPHADISDGNVTVGSNRTYTCNIGFEDNGEYPLITCNDSAMWNTTEFSCTVLQCAEPLSPSNGTILPGNNTVGSTRVVECNTGFALIGGSSTIECLVSQQNWSVWTGSCEICGEPETIQYAVISEGDLTVGSVRTYTCITGNEGNGESPNITCEDDGMWTSSLFSCSPIDCGFPPNIASMTFTFTGTAWLSTAEYSCNYGFVVSGNGTIVCSTSGEWSSTDIICSEYSTVIHVFDFEDDDLYNFVDASSYFSFESKTGSTTSSDTGPTGAYHGTKYRYYEGSGPEQNDVARMESDVYFNAGVQCIDFFYSMYGEDIGTMSIKYQGYGSSSETLIWNDSGDKQEPTWFNANVTVNATEIFKLIVEATKIGSGYRSDAAIDYIRLFDGAC